MHEKFNKELSYIIDTDIKQSARTMLDRLPEYFYEVPASSTGKYHPKFALGEGGLVRHTKAAVRIAHELLESKIIGSAFTDREKDLIIMSVMLHDGCKSGLTKTEYTVVNHPLIVAKLIRDNASSLKLKEEDLDLVCSMIESHMGEFNKDFKGNTILPLPTNKYQKFVHMCDLLASKKFLDIRFNEENNIIDD